MKARLVCENQGERIILEEMDLRELDQFTCCNFSDSSAIFSHPKYQSTLNGVGLDSTIYIGYFPAELSLSAAYLYPFEDAFSREQRLDVIYSGSTKKKPDQMSFFQDVTILLQDLGKVSKVYDLVSHHLSAEDKLRYSQGMFLRDPRVCKKSFDSFFRSMFTGDEGYFYTRLMRALILNDSDQLDECKKR